MRMSRMWGRTCGGLAVVVALGLLVPTSSESQVVSEIHALPAPPNLLTFAATPVAATTGFDASGVSEIEDHAASTALHVAALAQHQSIFDRPVHAPLTYTLEADQNITSVRRRYRVSDEDLQALNPGIDIGNVGPGDTLVVWAYDPDRPARSVNNPNRGRLENGEPMPEGEGWVVGDDAQAFGTPQLIEGLVHAMRVTQAEFPGGQELLVADISTARGGRMRPHRSHQSGRDVDITYYRRSTEPPTFSRVRPDELDEKRTWTFLRTLLTEHEIVYVFMARALQIRLFEYAESIGEHPAWLAEMFQYGPRGHRNSRAVVRLSPGHHDHMHIRFACTDADLRCRD